MLREALHGGSDGISSRLVCVLFGMRIARVMFMLSLLLAACADQKPEPHAASVSQSDSWNAVTDGRWSVWVTASDGSRRWDPVGAFNAWVESLPEDQRAWTILEPLSDELNELWSKDAGALPGDEPDEETNRYGKSWATIRAELEQTSTEAFAEQLRAALSRPVMGAPLGTKGKPSERTSFIEAEMVHLGQLRKAVQCLSSWAAHRLEHDDPDGYVDTLLVMLGAGSLANEPPMAINQFVKIACIDACLRNVAWALEHHGERFTDQHLVRLDEALAEHDRPRFVWQGEMLAFEDAVRRLARAAPSFDIGDLRRNRTRADLPEPSDEALHDPRYMLHASVVRTLERCETALRTAAGTESMPWDLEATGTGWFESVRADRDAIGNLLIELFISPADSAARTVRVQQQRVAAMRLAIAAYRTRLRAGSFPASIADIPSGLVCCAFRDGLTGDRLSYRVVDGLPLIYSIGRDGVDGGGSPNAGFRLVHQEQPGDWVLFPNREPDRE